MNYRRIHDQIISRAQNRFTVINGEKHHIIPRCEGGDNSATNLVKLTYKEHKIVHLLLVKLYPHSEGLKYAANLFSGKKIYRTSWNKGKRGIYSNEYRTKIAVAKRGRKLTPEHRAKIAAGSVTDRPINVFRVDCVQFRRRGLPSIYRKVELIATYPGVSKAATQLNIPHQWIFRVLNGTRKQCKGLLFEYAK